MSARLDAGRLLMGLGAVALLVSLFLDWYGEPGAFGEGVSAWTAFELVDVLLAALALGALAAAVREVYPDSRLPPVRPALAVGFVFSALVLVVVSLIDEPPAVFGADREAGAWVALGAVVAMGLGAFLSSARISVTIGPRETAATSTRPPAPDAETETLHPR
jgi:hypothetical protein